MTRLFLWVDVRVDLFRFFELVFLFEDEDGSSLPPDLLFNLSIFYSMLLGEPKCFEGLFPKKDLISLGYYVF